MKCTLEELNEMVEKANERCGGLDLRALTSIPDNFNPTVGGWLDLGSLTSIPDNFNPTVGGGLDLGSLTSIPDNFNPTVGGGLDLGSLTAAQKKKITVNRLANGDYIEGKYLYADGILTHVKRKKKIGDYIYYVGKIPGRNVISDGKNFAHCKNFKDGVCDLNFKAASKRGADQYKNLKPDSIISYEDARTMYRIITGACQAGTQQFIDSLPEIKEEYSIKEIIELTAGHYGHETFKRFFEEN